MLFPVTACIENMVAEPREEMAPTALHPGPDIQGLTPDMRVRGDATTPGEKIMGEMILPGRRQWIDGNGIAPVYKVGKRPGLYQRVGRDRKQSVLLLDREGMNEVAEEISRFEKRRFWTDLNATGPGLLAGSFFW